MVMWVFGYGSLMWDGWEEGFHGTRMDRATLTRYRRSFNKKSVSNWGTREIPGPTLGLEPDADGICVGTAFEFPDEQAVAAKTLLEKREGKSFSLSELTVRLPDGREVQALTPVNDRKRKTYIGSVPVAERARMARTANGKDGACADYVRNIHKQLGELGIEDAAVEEFMRLLEYS